MRAQICQYRHKEMYARAQCIILYYNPAIFTYEYM